MALEGLEKELTGAVGSIVRAKVEAAVVGALGDHDKIITQLVQAALTAPVNDNYRSISYLTKVCRDTVQEATRQAFAEILVSLKPEMERLIAAQIVAQKKDLAAQIVSSVLAPGSLKYRLSVNFEDRRED